MTTERATIHTEHTYSRKGKGKGKEKKVVQVDTTPKFKHIATALFSKKRVAVIEFFILFFSLSSISYQDFEATSIQKKKYRAWESLVAYSTNFVNRANSSVEESLDFLPFSLTCNLHDFTISNRLTPLLVGISGRDHKREAVHHEPSQVIRQIKELHNNGIQQRICPLRRRQDEEHRLRNSAEDGL